MTSDQFCYWLNGFAELNGSSLNDAQWQYIKDNLSTVFDKVTPNCDNGVEPQYKGTSLEEQINSKIDWYTIPSRFQWAAMDLSGKWFVYEREPVPNNRYREWDLTEEEASLEFLSEEISFDHLDWKKSKVKRPPHIKGCL